MTAEIRKKNWQYATLMYTESSVLYMSFCNASLSVIQALSFRAQTTVFFIRTCSHSIKVRFAHSPPVSVSE